jgi:two-component system, LytTR family, response regulator
MPGCDGFEVVRATADNAPAVIFVTALDAHAIHAFEVAAVDYLLKPVVEARFRAAVRRAIERAADADAGSIAARVAKALERAPAGSTTQLAVWHDGRALFVPMQHIDRIEADDDHVRVVAGKAAYTTRETMTKIEARLPADFVRVHRSCIINRARIREIQHWTKGDFVVILHDGTKVTTGKTYRDRVRALLPPRG